MQREIVIRLMLPQLRRRHLFIAIGAAVLGSAAIAYAMAPATFNAHDQLSASKLNDALASLQGQITTTDLGARMPSAFHASLTTRIDINGAPIPFDQVDFDLAGEYNRPTGAFVAKNAGVYLFNCSVFFTSTDTNTGNPNTWFIWLKKNNIPLTIVDIQSGTSAQDGGGVAPSSTTVVRLAANDMITCGAGIPQSTSTKTPDVNDPARNTFSGSRLY